jgi:phasin
MSNDKALAPLPKMPRHGIQGSTAPFEMPEFEIPKVEMPAAFREFAERGVAQCKDTYEKMKAAAEEATDVMETTYSTAAKGASDYGLKVIDAARTNTNATFDFYGELLTAKTLSEVIELSSTHARKQFETLTEQGKELAALAQKVTIDAAEPSGHSPSGEDRDAEFQPDAGRGTISAEKGASLFIRGKVLGPQFSQRFVKAS